MAKVRLDIGAEFDLPSTHELNDVFQRAQLDAEERERARVAGIQVKRIKLVGTPSGGNITLGDNGPNFMGPRDGYLWQVRRITVGGFGNNDTIGMFINEVQGTQYEWLFGQSFAQFTFGKGQMTLRPAEFLVFSNTFGALTATGQITVRGEALEIPMVMQGKLA